MCVCVCGVERSSWDPAVLSAVLCMGPRWIHPTILLPLAISQHLSHTPQGPETGDRPTAGRQTSRRETGQPQGDRPAAGGRCLEVYIDLETLRLLTSVCVCVCVCTHRSSVISTGRILPIAVPTAVTSSAVCLRRETALTPSGR